MNDKILKQLVDSNKNISASLDKLVVDVSEIKVDMSVLKTDVAVLKSDVSVLKSDVSVLKSDVSVLKSDVTLLKTDVNMLKEDVSNLKVESSRALVMLEDQRDKFLLSQEMMMDLATKADLKITNRELANIKSDVQVIKTVLTGTNQDVRKLDRRTSKLGLQYA